MVVFQYVGDDKWKRSKEILVSREAVARYDVRGVIIIIAARTRTR